MNEPFELCYIVLKLCPKYWELDIVEGTWKKKIQKSNNFVKNRGKMGCQSTQLDLRFGKKNQYFPSYLPNSGH